MKNLRLNAMAFLLLGTSISYSQSDLSIGANKTFKGVLFKDGKTPCQLQIKSYWLGQHDRRTVTKLEVVVGSPKGEKKSTLELFKNYPVGNSDMITFSTLPKDYFNWGRMRKEAYGMIWDVVSIKTDFAQDIVSYEYQSSGRSYAGTSENLDYQCIINCKYFGMCK